MKPETNCTVTVIGTNGHTLFCKGNMSRKQAFDIKEYLSKQESEVVFDQGLFCKGGNTSLPFAPISRVIVTTNDVFDIPPSGSLLVKDAEGIKL
jgi:hypothetical protein